LIQEIKAKPISDQFWILQQNNKKIGQVTYMHNKYIVNINGNNAGIFGSLTELKESQLFDVIEPAKLSKNGINAVHGYPTKCEAFNSVWNLQYKLPLFTFASNSKSWHAAGYYNIEIKGESVIQFCPKLITLCRNTYTGPFKKAQDI
jgi:hypothetical protein